MTRFVPFVCVCVCVHLRKLFALLQVFEHYQCLLHSENYVTKRQSLKVRI